MLEIETGMVQKKTLSRHLKVEGVYKDCFNLPQFLPAGSIFATVSGDNVFTYELDKRHQLHNKKISPEKSY